VKRPLRWGLVGAAVVALSLPIAGGALAFAAPATPAAPSAVAPVASIQPPPPPSKFDPVSDTPTVKTPNSGNPTTDRRIALSAPVAPSGCSTAASGTIGSAPSITSAGGVQGTTTADLTSFAQAYNAKRAANCLPQVPLANFRYDSCMEKRLFWMAEDPSTNPASAWGHIGTQRSDGVPSVGCDGNLAGGMNNSGVTVAIKWWDSTSHRTALYKPTYKGSFANVCIYFAMTHGGVPNEPTAFARAASRWSGC
jgi:uncharacterized protein YkwD